MTTIVKCNMMYEPTTGDAMPIDCNTGATPCTTNTTACPPFNVNQQIMMETGYTMLPSPLGSDMPYQGMWRDWLACSFAGSICMFLGALWLYKELVLLAFVLELVILPNYTAGIIYLRYNIPYNSVFTLWWYFAVLIV